MNKVRTKWLWGLLALGFVVLPGLLVSCGGGGDEPEPGDKTEEPEEPEVPVDPRLPAVPEPVAHNFLLGSLFGFERDVRQGKVGDDESSTRYNMPLFTGSEEEWWDNLVEEFAYSGMDYAMANCRGVLPDPNKYTDHGDPRHLKLLIEAMERRGVGDKFKIAIFDDCPASWAAARNLDLYGAYVPDREGKYDYPLDNLDGEGGIYKYIWDYNIKLAFQNVPDKYLLKFRDRPVLFLWSVNNFLNPGDNQSYVGKLSPILRRLREDFQAEFEVDPFIVVDRAFNDRDRTVSSPVVDGINDWFGMSNPYTVRTLGDVVIGVGIPGFEINDKKGNHMFVDADNGFRLNESLQWMVRSKSQIILVEGFTDVYENAALWRSTDTKYYVYPNQRLNILRRFSADPYPADLKVEAEACDFFEDTTKGNSGNAFRKGDLDVKKCTDTYGGWCVTEAVAGEWLKWRELPMRAGGSTFSIRYASSVAAEICFNVDGADGAKIPLPATGGEWKTIEAGSADFEKKGVHDVTVKIVSGTIDLNYFNILANN